MKHKNILAIVPARGGSKGFPGKNIKKLNGKPLMVWSIEAAEKSKCVTRTIVSSDSEVILDVARNNKVETIKRPARLSTDTASSESAVLHVLDILKRKENYVPTHIVLLQPTSPLRTADDIDNVAQLMNQTNSNLGISVFEIEKKFLKIYTLKNGKYLKGAVNDQYPYLPRQKLPPAYLPNGAIYMMKTSAFLRKGNFISDKAVPYVMEVERSIDIDDLEDFKLATKILKKGR